MLRLLEKPHMSREPRPITYRCEWCSILRTELRALGPTPRYCSPECKHEAQNALAAGRVRRMRQRQTEANPIPHWQRRPVGRPRKS
jgi:hypothetical protein